MHIKSLIVCVVSTAILTAVLGVNSNQKYVSTPIGDRPSQCVHFAEENEAILTIKEDVTIVHYPKSKRTISYPALEECVDDAKQIMERKQQNKKATQKDSKKEHEFNNYQDWVDYASSYVPDMGTFTALYTLPNQDPTDGGELLYYFIGLQNNDDSDITIIQPVIVYCGNCGQWDQGWSMVPWNCCPNGQSWYGTNYSVPAGSDIEAYVNANDTTVVVSSTYESETTTLVVSDRKRTFDWAAATLEEYDAYECTYYPSLPFIVSNMTLIDTAGRTVEPDWEATNDARCDGGVKIIDEKTVDIYGRDLP